MNRIYIANPMRLPLLFRNPLKWTMLLISAAGIFLSLPTSLEAQKNNQPKVIQLEEIKIEGRVQKPNAFYILNRSNLGYEVLELKTSFLPEIIQSVQKKPF